MTIVAAAQYSQHHIYMYRCESDLSSVRGAIVQAHCASALRCHMGAVVQSRFSLRIAWVSISFSLLQCGHLLYFFPVHCYCFGSDLEICSCVQQAVMMQVLTSCDCTSIPCSMFLVSPCPLYARCDLHTDTHTHAHTQTHIPRYTCTTKMHHEEEARQCAVIRTVIGHTTKVTQSIL